MPNIRLSLESKRGTRRFESPVYKALFTKPYFQSLVYKALFL